MTAPEKDAVDAIGQLVGALGLAIGGAGLVPHEADALIGLTREIEGKLAALTNKEELI